MNFLQFLAPDFDRAQALDLLTRLRALIEGAR